jgi:uncharacterized protein (UPF0335 family)
MPKDAGRVDGAMLRAAVEGDRPGKRMKADPDFDGAADKAYGVAAVELRQYVDKIRRLNQSKSEIADDLKVVVAEAKSRGYDTKALKYVVKWIDADRAAHAEFESVVEMYKAALGL